MREVRLDDIHEPGPVEPRGRRRPRWGNQVGWAVGFIAVAIALAGYEVLSWGFLIAGVVGATTFELVAWRRRRRLVRRSTAQ